MSEEYNRYIKRLPELVEGIDLTIQGYKKQLDVYKELPPNSTFAVGFFTSEIEKWEDKRRVALQEIENTRSDEGKHSAMKPTTQEENQEHKDKVS